MYQSVLNECKRDTTLAKPSQRIQFRWEPGGLDLPCPLPPPTRLSNPTPDVIRPRRPQSAGLGRRPGPAPAPAGAGARHLPSGTSRAPDTKGDPKVDGKAVGRALDQSDRSRIAHPGTRIGPGSGNAVAAGEGGWDPGRKLEKKGSRRGEDQVEGPVRPGSPSPQEILKCPARPGSPSWKGSNDPAETRPSTASTSCSARPTSANSTSRPGRHRLQSARRCEEAVDTSVALTAGELVALRPRSSSIVDRESRINGTIQRLLQQEHCSESGAGATGKLPTEGEGEEVDEEEDEDEVVGFGSEAEGEDTGSRRRGPGGTGKEKEKEKEKQKEKDKDERAARELQQQQQQQQQQQKDRQSPPKARKSKSPVYKIRAIGDEFRIHNAHMVVLARKFQNRKLANKIAAFDRRWVPSAGTPRLDFRSVSRAEESSSRAASKGRPEVPTAPTNSVAPGRSRILPGPGARSVFASSSAEESGVLDNSLKETLGEGLKDTMAAIGLERQEQIADEDGLYQVHYLIERQSSQHFDHLAISLTDGSGGTWQSAGQNAGGCVKNESLTFNLEFGPHSVSGIEFRIAETMSSPRRCRMQFSLDSSAGPWQDAWNFIVSSPGTRKVFRSSYDYAKNRQIFATAVVEIFGSIERAWQALTASNTESLKKSSLGTFFQKLHHEIGRDRGNPAKRAAAARVLSMDHKVLFRELDTNNEGYVTAEQLFWETPKAPTARYWRLLICDTWGGTPHVAVGGPLTLLSDMPQAIPKGERKRTFAAPAVGEDDPDSPQNQALRQELADLAKKYGLRPLEVQDIYGEFSAVDTDGGGTVSRKEFRDLLLKVFRLADPETLTTSRQDYYWKMVCPRQHQEEIEFEDLLHFCVQLGTNCASSSMYGRQDPHLAELSQALSQRLHNRLARPAPPSPRGF